MFSSLATSSLPSSLNKKGSTIFIQTQPLSSLASVAKKNNRNEDFDLNYIAKSILKRTADLVLGKEIANSSTICHRFFGFNENTALALMMCGSNVYLGFMVPFQQNLLRTFIDAAVKNPNSPSLYLEALIWLSGTQILSAYVHAAINARSCKKLREYLTYQMRDYMTTLWFETKCPTIASQTEAGAKIINSADDLVVKITNYCEGLMNLTNSRLSILSHFLGTIYSLYLASGFIEMTLLGLTFSIPYTIIICVLYAYAYNATSSWANTHLNESIAEKSTITDQFSKLIYHAFAQAKSIAFLDGESFENSEARKKNKEIQIINEKSLKPQTWVSFFNKIHADGGGIVGTFAHFKELLEGNMDPLKIFVTVAGLKHLVDQACFDKNNIEALKRLAHTADQLQRDLDAINQVKELTKNCAVKYISHDDKVDSVEVDLAIPIKNNPNQSFSLKKSLQKGNIYRITGPSGAGKSTLLEVLKGGINPSFASGSVTIPRHSLFLPQTPYILKGKEYSLMDTILYPNPNRIPATKAQLNLAKVLLEKLKLDDLEEQKVPQTTPASTPSKEPKDGRITELYQTVGLRDWDACLSLGQKQKITFISCLIKKPDALFLDEPFASMDPDSRRIAIDLLYQYLPHSIVLYIEHKRNIREIEQTDNTANPKSTIDIVEEKF